MSTKLLANAATFALLISALVCSHAAHAQDRDPAAAEALFAQGRELMNAQRYAEACLKLAESQRLDPGIGTEFHLAVCYEHEGKLASAWAAFRDVVSLATANSQPDRAAAAGRRASLLEPRLPKLKIVVPPAARAPGMEIMRDATIVRQAQWDTALPVDPGNHPIEVTAPGRRAFSALVNAVEGTTQEFEVPPLESAGAAETVAALGSPVAAPVQPLTQPVQQPQAQLPAPTPAPAREAPSNQASSSGPGALVIGLGIVGVVGVGVGVTLGLMAGAKNKDSKEHCPTSDTVCDAEGVNLRDKAFTFSDIATVGFIAGGAALATAGILWLLRGDSAPNPDSPSVAVHADLHAANVTLGGRF